jgi:hypothetical protein
MFYGASGAPKEDAMGVKITGLDEVKRNLSRFAEKAQALNGPQSIPAAELFSPDFLVEHTSGRFQSFGDWVGDSGLDVSAQAQLAGPSWDSHVRATTDFGSIDEMKGAAIAEWAKAKLFE